MLNPQGNTTTDFGRKKFSLGKGYSLMDWIRLTKTTPDLAGNGGVMRQITYEELAKHNTENDCWMAINNKVYNVTPYIKFHPGGVEEIMKGAGINATAIFNDVHPWVNLQNMMEKCVVGGLVGIPSKESTSQSLNLSNPSLNQMEISDKDKAKLSSDDQNKAKLNFDSYQTAKNVTIVIYTKWKEMQANYLIIDQIRSSENSEEIDTLVLFIYLKDQVYTYSTEINSPIKNDYKVKVSKEGKVELILTKEENLKNNVPVIWRNIGINLKFKSEIVTEYVRSGFNYRECILVEKKTVTHDTFLYVFSLPESTKMCTPIGYHVFLKFFKSPDHYPIKPYTVVSDSLLDDHINENGRQICLMIKEYPEGFFTSKLSSIKIGSKIYISNFTGSFNYNKLLDCEELILLSAGTGFTPMTRLMIKAVDLENIKNITLVFFNKKSRDILWLDELEEFRSKYANRVNVTHVLSEPDNDWTGKTGRINDELFKDLIVGKVSKPFFCTCGPKGFTDLTTQIIEKNGFLKDSTHVFLG